MCVTIDPRQTQTGNCRTIEG